MKKKALISVSDKTGIIELGNSLIKNNYEILATGNTSKLLKENNIACTEISIYTGSPEIFHGRLKTLHPKIFGGILYRRDNENDLNEANENSIDPIDIVCVNLYPFAKVVNQDVDQQTKIENIDIGGPSLIRAAAKNFKFISVLTNSDQYLSFIEELEKSEISDTTKSKLAAEAFSHTAQYDKIIADFFEREITNQQKNLRISFPLHSELRYGENPHQKAYLYGNFYENFIPLHGKELSYNNIIDLVAAVDLVNELDNNSCAIIKHTNPCGAATGKNVLDAYVKALSCDPVSAFGGIVAFNNEVNVETAEKINEIFTEVICAPSFEEKALEILKQKKNRRVIKFTAEFSNQKLQFRSIPNGIIAQEIDNSIFPENTLQTVTEKQITEDQYKDLKFAWVVCKHTKSNAIVFCKNQMAIGVGAGQMSRVDSSRIAVEKAMQNGHNLDNAVAASDAFFPFADGVEQIADSGITAIIQPGGSVRDEEVILAANKKNISMLFTGIRNFKH
ncbi:MAG: bifunctional phosphoribosylaminoimidazolecarboxamide formyltransferase/IMP cyclohydrolase [Ignavibacteriae bacterium]|nr:bifunctional phosphoribosylaminoimidazolecarboxamide formyltransferase/IMP cyclohydrolase [Ignavibacteriota bacterium]